jgi:hypothetical protein
VIHTVQFAVPFLERASMFTKQVGLASLVVALSVVGDGAASQGAGVATEKGNVGRRHGRAQAPGQVIGKPSHSGASRERMEGPSVPRAASMREEGADELQI